MNNTKSLLTPCARDGGTAFSVMMFLYVFVAFIGQTILSGISNNSLLYNAISAFFPAIALFLAGAYIVVFNKCDLQSVISIRKFNPLWLLICVALCIGMFLGLGFINTAFQKLLLKLGLNATGRTLSINGVGELIVYIFTLALVPAVSEEIFFRGLILNSLSGVKKMFAVLISSLCFALYHASAVQFFYQFLFGVCFALLAMSAKSVVPCIFAHFINNAVVLLFTYFGVNIDLFNLIVIAVGLIILLVVTFVLVKPLLKNKAEKITDSVKKFFVPFGSCIKFSDGGLKI